MLENCDIFHDDTLIDDNFCFIISDDEIYGTVR
jgi:hypothetical protein